ncbi:DUF262 domain-containing protein [Luteimonas sp. XNQY3]|nr:DUF262 domain-containing protein [Luteimonas sp. XNQY3]MCD9008237.1 DUF262 domain-containing protein [Luteimonas sp. XNQY3]
MSELEIPNDQQEDEDDIAGGIDFRTSVVVNSDWTIETVNLQIRKGNIDLQPRFQRRAAWDDVRKSRLIESIIAGMPVPNIVLAENKEQRGKFIVIDGKQRLVSISQFINGEYSLKGLDIRPDLNDKRYGDLDVDDRNNFDNSTLRSTVIKNWHDENFLYAIFYRLNSGSLPLSPQELRKALTGGNLIDYIEEYLIGSRSFQALFGTELDKRMRDSELVLRFIAFDNFLPGYDGNFKKFLDAATRYFEEDWAERKKEVDASLSRLDGALDCTREVFGQDSFKKWIGDKYERVVNRAVFDCIARFFADQLVRGHSVLKKFEVEEAFKELCSETPFKEAVERTTKSKNATFLRINRWGDSLSAVIGRKYDKATLRIT